MRRMQGTVPLWVICFFGVSLVRVFDEISSYMGAIGIVLCILAGKYLGAGPK